MCESLFSLLLDPSPSRESVFVVVWRIKVFKKVRFLSGQGRVNIVRRTLVVGPCCCLLCWKAEKSLDHLFWDCQYV